MSEEEGGGCGCVGFIAFVFVMWALLFGLPVPGGCFTLTSFHLP